MKLLTTLWKMLLGVKIQSLGSSQARDTDMMHPIALGTRQNEETALTEVQETRLGGQRDE